MTLLFEAFSKLLSFPYLFQLINIDIINMYSFLMYSLITWSKCGVLLSYILVDDVYELFRVDLDEIKFNGYEILIEKCLFVKIIG